MKNAELNHIAEEIFAFFPPLYKTFLRIEHAGTGRSHYPVLGMLAAHGPLPMSEIGRRLHLSKPHMTSLVGKMIADGKVERLPDANDRRVVKVGITRRGRAFLQAGRRAARENIKQSLRGLSEQEIRRICSSIENLQVIFAKLRCEEEEGRRTKKRGGD
jgi:DNA-binding MarR family transcriptional regulator